MKEDINSLKEPQDSIKNLEEKIENTILDNTTKLTLIIKKYKEKEILKGYNADVIVNPSQFGDGSYCVYLDINKKYVAHIDEALYYIKQQQAYEKLKKIKEEIFEECKSKEASYNKDFIEIEEKNKDNNENRVERNEKWIKIGVENICLPYETSKNIEIYEEIAMNTNLLTEEFLKKLSTL